MAKTLSDSIIVAAVRKNLDEIGLNDSLFDTDNSVTDEEGTPRDETDLDLIIKQKIPEAYRFILEKAPVELLNAEVISEKQSPETETTDEEQSSETETTDEEQSSETETTDEEQSSETEENAFVNTFAIKNPFRFVYAISSGWLYPVYEPIMWSDPEYSSLMYAQTTGTKERPKVGIAPSSTRGCYDVTLYGAERDARVGYVDLSTPYITEETKLESSLYDSLIYYVSGLVLLTLRDETHAENMTAQALSLLGINTSRQTL